MTERVERNYGYLTLFFTVLMYRSLDDVMGMEYVMGMDYATGMEYSSANVVQL